MKLGFVKKFDFFPILQLGLHDHHQHGPFSDGCLRDLWIEFIQFLDYRHVQYSTDVSMNHSNDYDLVGLGQKSMSPSCNVLSAHYKSYYFYYYYY